VSWKPEKTHITDKQISYRMGLFSLFRKNKQESASGRSEFLTRTEDESTPAPGRSKRKKRSQGNEPVDPALPEKKRARRRLVGAVALVLAAVIALPMILDSEPKPLADDISIQIPSKDSPVVSSASNRPVAPSPDSKLGASAALDKDEEIVQSVTPIAVQQSATANSGSMRDAAGKNVPADEPVARSEDKVAVQSIGLKKMDDPERARAILEAREPDKPSGATKSQEAKSTAYLVQVAALASQNKVDELQRKLKSAGIKSYTQKVATASGERIRVRVGPFPSKEEADKMRAKIGKLGLNGTLVPA
jgi:DedD protein